MATVAPERVDLSDRLLTKEKVAALLQVRFSTVAELARRQGGPIPSLKVGRARRYQRQRVEEWLARQE